MKKANFLLLPVVLSMATLAHSQNSQNSADPGETAKSLTDFIATSPAPPSLNDLVGRADFDVPEIPAISVLGLSGETVSRPATGKALITEIISSLDANGNPQSGLALQARPYMLVRGPSVSLSDYANSISIRQLSRISASIASTKGDSDQDKADRYSFGLNWTPINHGDPRLNTDLHKCFIDNVSWTEANTRQEDLDPDVLKRDIERNKKATDQCLEKFEKDEWNAMVWTIGAVAHDSKVDDIDESGYAFWSSFAHPLGEDGQVIYHVKYANDLLKPLEDQEGSFYVSDQLTVGSRMRYGWGSGAFMIEATYNELDSSGDMDDEQYWQGAIGSEFKITDDFWLQLAIGQTFGRDDDIADDETIYTARLRWGFTKDSLFKAIPSVN